MNIPQFDFENITDHLREQLRLTTLVRRNELIWNSDNPVGYEIEFDLIENRPTDIRMKVYNEDGEELDLTLCQIVSIKNTIWEHCIEYYN